jgi:hypothetical protein
MVYFYRTQYFENETMRCILQGKLSFALKWQKRYRDLAYIGNILIWKKDGKAAHYKF